MYGGPTGMCRLVVRQAAAGIARHLLADVADARTRGVVVTFDARHRSDVFARDAAEVVAAHGIPVTLEIARCRLLSGCSPCATLAPQRRS